MIMVVVIGTILMITIVANLLHLIPSDRCRKLLVTGHHPGTVIMVGPIPVVTLKEVVDAGNQHHIMGHINPHIKPQ
jgi:hypothetical protein